MGVSFFLFIAVIAPSITFGAVYAKRTNNHMGAVELLLATAWCGIFYSLVSGMPMVRMLRAQCCDELELVGMQYNKYTAIQTRLSYVS